MLVFKLSWSDWDEYSYYLLTHPDPHVTEATYRLDVDMLMQTSMEDYLALDDTKSNYLGMDGYTNVVYNKLLAMGYKDLETVSFHTSGQSVFNNEDTESDTFRKLLGEVAWNTALQHNRRIERRNEDNHSDSTE